MENEKPKLKPCPFCGSDNLRVHRGVSVFYGYCCNCGCQSGWAGTETQAAERWNNRPTDTVKEQLAEALAELREAYSQEYYDDEAVDAAEKALAAYREEQAL